MVLHDKCIHGEFPNESGLKGHMKSSLGERLGLGAVG